MLLIEQFWIQHKKNKNDADKNKQIKRKNDVSSDQYEIEDYQPQLLGFLELLGGNFSEDRWREVEMLVNLYSWHLRDLSLEISEKVTDAFLEKIIHRKNRFNTSDSAIAYNILTYYHDKRDWGKFNSFLDPKYHDERLQEIYNFISKHKTRFWWQLICAWARIDQGTNIRPLPENPSGILADNLEELLREYNIVNDNIIKNYSKSENTAWENSHNCMRDGTHGQLIQKFINDYNKT